MANRLREYRIQQGYTLEDVVGITGYCASYISRVERGERTPSPEARVLIARRLGVQVADLFDPEPVGIEVPADA